MVITDVTGTFHFGLVDERATNRKFIFILLKTNYIIYWVLRYSLLNQNFLKGTLFTSLNPSGKY